MKLNSIFSKDRKKKGVIVALILLNLLLIGCLIAYKEMPEKVESAIATVPALDKLVGNNKVVYTQTEGEFNVETEKARLQKEVEDNTLNARIAASISPDADGKVFLSLKNKYDDKLLQVVIVNEATHEKYYTSPILHAQEEVVEGVLTKVPEEGEQECIAYFYYYTLDEQPISTVGAKIKLLGGTK